MISKKEMITRAHYLANEFLKFNTTAISPFHAAANVEKLLKEKNFIKLEEGDVWNLQSGQGYYMIKGGSSVVAFTVPAVCSASQTGFKLICTHTDSPCIRLAPNFETSSAQFVQCFVQCYGGGLWNTWLDRELILGGRVAVRKGDVVETHLFSSGKPIAKIANLAIHLKKERNKVEIDKEKHLRPIVASSILLDDKENKGLRQYIARDFGVEAEQIIGFDLCFADACAPAKFGLQDEFISSPRLDNLYSVFCSTIALLETLEQSVKDEESNDINVLFMFDHEEIGSQTYIGAQSNLASGVLQRICSSLKLTEPQDFARVMSRSFMLSCDMGHSIHPNYTAEHQAGHTPHINEGVVLKINCNGRYTSETFSVAAIKNVAESGNIPLIDYIVHNESPCGSTVGPLLASALGCHAVDIGAPMLAMHSIRETAGVIDFYYYTELMKRFISLPLHRFLPK